MSTESLALPSGVVSGRLRPPGSKSETNRWINLAILARQPFRLRGALRSEDIELFLSAAKTLGLTVGEEGGDLVLAPNPRGGRGDAVPTGARELFCGNGGTMTRFLVATAAVIPGNWRIDGVERLRERPIGPLISALRELGASIRELGASGFVPIEVEGRELDGGTATLDAGASSQYLSALLMAGQRARGPWSIEVAALTSRPYVALTVDAVRRLGGKVEETGGGFHTRPATLSGATVEVAADVSAACYAAAGAALTGGAVELRGVSATSLQGDWGFFELLARMGARVEETADGTRVTGGGLEGLEVDASAIPDQVPTLVALGPFLRGGLKVRGAAHLRIKESDRLAAMGEALRSAGASSRETRDGIEVPGIWHQELSHPPGVAVIDPRGDHRIAMSAAVIGLRRPGLVVSHPGVVVKSYPGFWQDWDGLVRQ